MKKIKFLLVMAMVSIMSLTMSADDDDRVITFDQLPQPAQTFLKQNFANKVPLIVTADVIPSQIAAYINKNYLGKMAIKFERHRSMYEVKLNNGMEIEFNRNFQVIDVDFDD